MTEAVEKTTAELIEKIGRQTRRGYVDVVMETAEWQQLKSAFEAQERLIETLTDALEDASEKMWAYGFSEDDLRPIRKIIEQAERDRPLPSKED